MKVILEGDPKEIAALAAALREQQYEVGVSSGQIAVWMAKNHPEFFTTEAVGERDA